MPAISEFFGIAIYLYFFDNKKHNEPHFHAEYGDFNGTFSMRTGLQIEGDLPQKQQKYITKWVELHRDELLNNWYFSIEGKAVSKIEPLR